jgi:ATP-dependent RNA helicase DeaD
MVRYRIEVGRNHEARPGDIVGAIANEAGISSSNIGHIKLHDEFSTVDLPKGLSSDVLSQLKKVRVRNRPLEISVDQGGAGGASSGGKDRDFGDRGPRTFDKPRDSGDRPRESSDRPRSDKPRSFSDKPRDSAPRSFSDKPRDGAPRGKLGFSDKAKESKSFRPKKTD